VGVLASLGHDRVQAYRRPVVAVLSTGDELLRPGEPLTPGKIYDSNAFSLAAQVRSFGGIPRVLDVARDTVEALTARIQEALTDADMLVTSAGVSRGDFDVVKTVLANEGQVGFWTVQMKPGKPLAFGTFRGESERSIPHLGLPGNPVSAMLTFELFGRAAIFKMLGKEHAWPRPVIRAVTKDRIRNTDGRRFYARVFLDEEDGAAVVRLTGPQGSGERVRDLPRGPRLDRARRGVRRDPRGPRARSIRLRRQRAGRRVLGGDDHLEGDDSRGSRRGSARDRRGRRDPLRTLARADRRHRAALQVLR
jgi:molybdopterin molybdotransferase